MPELRQNIVTREWVIIARERAKRPNVFAESEQIPLSEERAEHDPTCPFCPGNEELDLEIERYPEEGAWQTRVVLNKFPALNQEGVPERRFSGVHRWIAGFGYHEVVVLHPHHNTTLALMSPEEIYLGLAAFQRRGRIIATDPRIEHIIYFKNHGERAGASLHHPHCQIIALPVTPNNVRRRLEESWRYFDDNGACSMCNMLADELTHHERVVATSEHFVAFVLYAALSPFHMWIVPRKHGGCFLETEPHVLEDLAHILKSVLHAVYVSLHDPAYNMIIRTAPVRESRNIHFHWYLSLVPRVSRMAGFELGSGMHINACPPEECATFLRSARSSD